MKDKAFNHVSERVPADEIEAWLFDLIRIESHADAPGQETRVAEYLRDLLRQEGIEARLEEAVAGRPNILARVGNGNGGPTLALNGHLDTVPAYGMDRAFEPRAVGNRIYGRGSSDMKGALAAMVGVLVAIRRSGADGAGSVVFAGTVGEEARSEGGYRLATGGFRADYAIVGESTELRVGVAHKGVIWCEAVFEGRAAHGSVPDKGVNAIAHASRWIEAMHNEYIPNLKNRTHPLLGHPTLNIGMIDGGTRPTIVPARCSVKFERRLLPGETPSGVLTELRDAMAALARRDSRMTARIDEMPVFGDVPHGPMESARDGRLVQALQAAHTLALGRPAEVCGLQYWTDGALLATIPGIEVAVCGPGAIARAHSNDEYLERDQLRTAYRMYLQTAMTVCG